LIVDPDFLDHWRTGMVADAIGDPMAPVYILRLWAHCQTRKSDRFVMPTAGLKAQCKCPADAALFERALIDAGYLERDGDMVIVLGWADANAALLAAWSNGAKGGRPKKNPDETPGKPAENPPVNQGETAGQPPGNPGETDKSREEKNSSSLRSEESGFSRFWALWPRHDRKSARKQCEEKWRSKGCEEIAETVIDSLNAWIVSDAWTRNDGEFIPAPLVWLNQSRWEGAPPKRSRQASAHTGFDSKDYHAGANADGSF
jgi:hypothetical protein